MHKILIIEDSRSTAKLIQYAIMERLGIACDIAMNMTEAEGYIQPDPAAYAIVLCDLNLPDAPAGEAVDMVMSYRLPCVVVSAGLTKASRLQMLHKPISDYVLKRGTRDIQYLIGVVERLLRNEKTKVLVVDDSNTYRKGLVDMLTRQRLQVLEACNGVQALEVLEENPDIQLILSDYNMPLMDGFQLTEAVRARYAQDRVAIIVTTGLEEDLAAQFLRYGANDFIPKAASFEELLCRIHMNLNMLDLIRINRDLSEKDPLTGLYNRRMLFKEGGRLIEKAGESGRVTAAMLDIDHFKKVNDTYGHAGGDLALRCMGDLITRQFPPPCITARYGGEEFCILFPDTVPHSIALEQLEVFRSSVEALQIPYEETAFSFTVSIGVARATPYGLDDTLNAADQRLYEAKRSGRNRIQFCPPQ